MSDTITTVGTSDEDTIQLLGLIEETFDFQFAEHDVIPENLGKLCELVISRLPGHRTSKCVASATFYALRRAMMQVTGCRRESITPSAALAGVFSRGGLRRKEWKTVEKYLALRMPRLTFSNGLETCFSLAWFAVAAAVVIWFLPRRFLSPWGLPVHIGSWMGAIVWTGSGAFLLWAITWAALRPLATQFPTNCDSVGDLVRLIVATNYGRMAKRVGGWNDQEVWITLRDLIADAISVEPDQITPETSFPVG
jgi:acyl carrier protein